MGSSSDGDRPWQSYHTVYTNAKAGMDGVDKEKVQKVVYEMSKGSRYFENEQRKDAYIQQKISNLHAHCARLTENEISHFQKLADRKIMELEARRDLSKVWLHSDMDAFYAAVEMLEDPSFSGKPLAVGSMSMVCTANYEARKYGVRAAMPGFIARKLCPELIFVPPNLEKYTHYSQLTRKVFRKYDPNFLATSLDEAYLNITDICTGRAISIVEVAEELRTAIHEETGLTCSVGVAPNRLLAKVCSDINKPNGQYVLPNDRRAVMAFVSTLPIRKIGGIGKVTEHLLREGLGVTNCEEMLQKRALICALFSRCSSDFFLSAALGLGQTETPQFKNRKSISCERTFAATTDPAFLFQKLEDLAESLSNEMQNEGLRGRTLTLKLKTESFEVRTRAASMQRYYHRKEDILCHAIKLLKAELPLSLRLMGLRMSQFEDDRNMSSDPAQKTLSSFVVSGYSHQSLMFIDHSNCSDVGENGIDADIDFIGGNDIYSSSDRHSKSMLYSESDIGEYMPDSDIHTDLDELMLLETDNSNMVKELNINETASSFEAKMPKTVSLSGKGEKFIWVDGYICSVCGLELPPSFHEERQEHSDYHLAEILQKEENEAYPGDISINREAPRNPSLGGRPQKKLKHSPCSGKYLPIDSFFVKIKKDE